MPQKLPMISGKEAVKAFSRGGWHVDRIAGIHAVMRKEKLCGYSLCATSSGTEKGPASLFDRGFGYRFRRIPNVFDCSWIIKRLLDNLLDALKCHQAETAAELDALLPSVLERAFRGEL